MTFVGPTLEAVDDAHVARLSAVAESVLDPALSAGPTIAAVPLEDLPDSLTIDHDCLVENLIGMVSVVGLHEQFTKLR